MVERTETCEGCGHPLRLHFRNVMGEVVCVHSYEGNWYKLQHCDCVDYRSEIEARRKAREARMKDMKRFDEIPLSHISKEIQD